MMHTSFAAIPLILQIHMQPGMRGDYQSAEQNEPHSKVCAQWRLHGDIYANAYLGLGAGLPP